jgi:hypothetical protein
MPARGLGLGVFLDQFEVLDRHDHEVEGFTAVVGDLDFLVVALVADDGAECSGRPVADSVDLLDRSFEGDDVDFSDCLLLDRSHSSSSLGLPSSSDCPAQTRHTGAKVSPWRLGAATAVRQRPIRGLQMEAS